MQDADLDRAALEIGEIARYGLHQPLRAADQVFGRPQHGMAGVLDLRDRGADLGQHIGDGAGDAFGAVADAIDLYRLMIEDAGELAVGVAHGGDAGGDRRDGADGLLDRPLDIANLRPDIAGRLGGLLRQRLHLAGHHREASAGGAGAGGLDGGIERQQRGLGGDRFDQLHHHADALGGGGEAAHAVIGARQVVDGAIGGVLGGRHLDARARDQRQQVARREADRLHIAGGVGRRLGRRGGAQPHILAARPEVGGGHPDLLAGLVEGRDHLVDGGAELLGDEGVAGKVKLGFRYPAAMRDRERIGIDQGLTHPLGGGRDLGHGPAADPLRQRGITVAGGDLADGLDDRAQAALGPPCCRQAGRQRRGGCQRQAFGGPARPGRCPGCEQNGEQDPPRRRLSSNFGCHFENVIGDCRRFDETACFRLPNPFPMLRLQRDNILAFAYKNCAVCPPVREESNHDRTDGGLRQRPDQLRRPRLLALPAPLVCEIHGLFRRDAGQAGGRHRPYGFRIQQLPSPLSRAARGGQARRAGGRRAAGRVSHHLAGRGFS